MSKHCLVIGSGAIGSYYAAKLIQSSARVSLLSRSDYDVIKNNGFQITYSDGVTKQYIPDQTLSLSEPVNSTFDYVIMCTKVLPSIDFKALITPYLSSGTTIVLIQNGIQIEDIYQRHFSDHQLISGLAFICVSRLSPGHIYHYDYGKLTLGLYPHGSNIACQDLIDLFTAGGADCQLSHNISKERYIKLLWNASFNPLSVLKGGLTTSELLDSPETIQQIRSIMKEVCLLAQCHGHVLNDDIIDSMIQNTKKMAPYKTSMLLDYERGYKLETEAILGNALMVAQDSQLQLPLIQSLYNQLNNLK